jgi:hypothetical protein
MAITPRTILTTPATAAVAAASLFALTAAGMYAFNACGASSCSRMSAVEVDFGAVEQADSCLTMAERLGDRAGWTEFDWFQFASCYDVAKDSPRAVEAASEGIGYFPASEALYNLKGYHLILMRDHTRAVETLEEGMRQVGYPTSGTMPNNLAWAGLWVPRELKLDRARELYRLSLALDRNVCESLHTGMWVEFAIADQAQGMERADALRTLGELRSQYEPCRARYKSGDWTQMMEVLGAEVLYADIDEQTGEVNASDLQVMQDLSSMLRSSHRGASIDSICREAVPTDNAHHRCVELVHASVQAHLLIR